MDQNKKSLSAVPENCKSHWKFKETALIEKKEIRVYERIIFK